MSALTDIELMLARIRQRGHYGPWVVDLREGPRPETERALTAPFKRAVFTCGYCGGHDCNRLLCGVKQIEDASSSAKRDR